MIPKNPEKCEREKRGEARRRSRTGLELVVCVCSPELLGGVKLQQRKRGRRNCWRLWILSALWLPRLPAPRRPDWLVPAVSSWHTSASSHVNEPVGVCEPGWHESVTPWGLLASVLLWPRYDHRVLRDGKCVRVCFKLPAVFGCVLVSVNKKEKKKNSRFLPKALSQMSQL